jgi:ribosomal protein S18 acetylase RimI-like enzyme
LSLEIRQEDVTPGALGEHEKISIAFVVDRILEVALADGGLGGVSLTETPVPDPYVKDYDAIDGEGPTRWAERFDTSNWGMIGACRSGARVGGAVIAFRTAGLRMLDGRDDVAALWDIRVMPGQRGAGVGSALFRAAERWAATRACRWLKIETQNVNTAACRFYRKMGCTLGGIDRFAYPRLPGEVQLMWWKALPPAGAIPGRPPASTGRQRAAAAGARPRSSGARSGRTRSSPAGA